MTWLDREGRLTLLQRAALSHEVRIADRTESRPILTTFWIEEFVKNARLPSVVVQLANLIRLIGDYQSETGVGFFPDSSTDTFLVGALNERMFDQLLDGLKSRGWLVPLGTHQKLNPRGDGMIEGRLVGLSLDGWERFEAERRGKIAGRYGFLAMKFGDVELERLAQDVIKPRVRSDIGYEVVDLRNVARAGVIDNIMREQIRDSAFVVVDLTHDNSGAYWEAGYAEGLGKPVIYICQREKFERAQTHFDTNHCTTVMWDAAGESDFADQLVATIRRSLSLFAS